MFALFGVGTWTGSGLGRGSSVGRVLTAVPEGFVPPFAAAVTGQMKHVHFMRSDEIPPHEPHHDPIPSDDPSNERVLGRIFAWLCTTLYLTSRLPQIWKNVRLF